jgi:hypothetical protein
MWEFMFFTLKIEAGRFSKVSVPFYKTTRNIPEGDTIPATANSTVLNAFSCTRGADGVVT